MSRIGKAPITVPSGVTITFADGVATVKGPKGTVTAPVPANFETNIEGGTLTITRPSETKQDRAQHGLTRALLFNAVQALATASPRFSNCAASVIAPKFRARP